MQTRHAPSPCPNCHKALDGATSVGGHRAPKPGDFSVFLYCGHLSAFDLRLRLREPTDEEILAVAGRIELVQAQKMRAEFLKQKGEPHD